MSNSIKLLSLSLSFFFLVMGNGFAQNNRETENNTIGWYAFLPITSWMKNGVFMENFNGVERIGSPIPNKTCIGLG